MKINGGDGSELTCLRYNRLKPNVNNETNEAMRVTRKTVNSEKFVLNQKKEMGRNEQMGGNYENKMDERQRQSKNERADNGKSETGVAETS